jgi:hypothetical protein
MLNFSDGIDVSNARSNDRDNHGMYPAASAAWLGWGSSAGATATNK